MARQGPSPLEGVQLGPFRLGHTLGTGGMGTVHRAEVTGAVPGLDAGALVALKIVHPHLLEQPGFFKRFLREARIGRAVRHENVVRTLDVDALSHDGTSYHFLVMEYVEGQTLRELLAELECVPEELCRHVGREMAKGLAAIHGTGVVHRDLKPENVLITGDHVVKVMDLGVARLQDEAVRLSQTGAFVGSIHYAAPEQFGEASEVDHRADLHALGLVLYELACGQHPYYDRDVRTALKRLLNDEPRRLAEISPQLSPFFEEVVHKLLSKSREERFATAAQLADVLDAGEASDWWQERARTLRIETRRPLRRVRIRREAALYGRDAELEQLRALYDDVKRGDGRVLLVGGEAGIGKTRLVDEFVGQLRQGGEDLNFLFGSYPPGGAATAAGAFSTAYREHFGSASIEDVLREYLAETPLLVPAFGALLTGDTTRSGQVALTKDSLQTVFVHATRALAAERPTIVLIDDLHFAPDEGRALFTALAMAVPGRRVLLVGTQRPGVPSDWLAGATRLEQTTQMWLQRLGAKDLVRLLEDTLKSARLAEQLVGQIALKSDGNPFFAFEIIRGLREGQFITQQADGSWVSTQAIDRIRIPSSVLDLISARVSDLSEEERDLLDVACCCGFEFDPLVVGAALGLPPIPVLKRLSQIERAHRLVRSLGMRHVFDHHQVQEALYESLPELLRQEYHAAIAAALEARAGAADADPADLDGAVAVELSGHFLLGDQGGRALRYLDAALDHLTAGYVNDQAIDLAGRALAVPDLVTGEARVRLLLRKVGPLDTVGRRDEEREALDEALALAEALDEPELRARAETRLGWYEFRFARYDEAEAYLLRAEERARTVGAKEIECDAVWNLANISWARSDIERAREHYGRARLLARETGLRAREAATAGALGNLLSQEGRYEEAVAAHEQHLAIARDMGNPSGQSIAHGNLGSVLQRLGRVDEARSHLERALELSQQMGDRRGEISDTGNLALLHECHGRFDAARTLGERCLLLCRENGDRRAEGLVQDDLGRIWVRLGLPDRGRELLRASLTIAEEIGFRLLEGHVRWSLGQAAELTGDGAEAERRHRESVALLREIGARGELSLALGSLGGVLAAAGRAAEAKPVLEEALEVARETNRPSPLVLAACYAARLPGGDARAALDAFAEHGERLEHAERLEARYLLWKVTGDDAHVAAAHDLLEHLREYAPAECRDSVVESVAMHREIWEARGGDGV